MTPLVYRCPHCGASHEIPESLVGDRVDCRECGRVFEAAAPVAQAVQNEEGAAATYHVEAGEGEIEDIILATHPSIARKNPLAFLGCCIAIIVGLIAAVGGGIGTAWYGISGSVLLIAGLVCAAGGALVLLYWWLESRFTTLEVTNRRTRLRHGIVSRKTSEVRHRDVRNLQVDQNFLDRLLGVGTIAISSAGQDDLEIVVPGIVHPEKIAAVVRDMQS